MKRFFAIILSLIMLFTMLPLVGVAESRDSVCRCTLPEVEEWFYSGTNDCTASSATRVGVCKACGGYFTEEIPVQPFHKLYDLPMYDENGLPVVNDKGEPNYLPPTCDEKGYIRKKCSTCHMVVEEVIDEKGHKYGEDIIYVRCFVEGDPKDTDGVVNNLTPGITRRYCQNDGCDHFEEERSVNHMIHKTEERPATCFSSGRTAYMYCVTCGTESFTEEIPQLSHADEDGNGKCDHCMSQYRDTDGVYCSCMCHSENKFIQFLMPLLKLIWRILGMDNCHGECNALHYEQ